MTSMVEVPLAKSYLLLNHGPVTLVSSAANGRSNVMAAAWAMPLDFDPAKVLLVVDSQTLTRELIEVSGEFALSIPCRRIADKVVAAWADPALFSGGRWLFPDTDSRTIHYQAGGSFFVTGDSFEC